MQESTQTGLVVAAHGRHVLVETPSGERLRCHPRGKKNETVVGDHVRWIPTGDEGSIESIEPRRNLFFRRDEVRTKAFAANLDQILVLTAAEPEFSEHQLARALIAAKAEGINALIGLNKRDLGDAFARAWQRLEPYRQMGYEVLPLALKPAHDRVMTPPEPALVAALDGRTTLLLGASGVGKSTLTNSLAPHAQALTNEISRALQAGRHTTTSTTWYWVDRAKETALIDSPGFQEFGLQHVGAMQLAQCMPDIERHANACRFHNCTHLHEPGCGVIAAVAEVGNGAISPRRYRIYGELFAELSRSRY